MENIESFITQLQHKIEPIEDKLGLLRWEFANSGSESLQSEIVEYELKLHAIYSDQEAFSKIKKWKDESIKDERFERIVQLLYNAFLSHQEPLELAKQKAELDAALTGHFANFRSEMRGKKLTVNEIKELMKNSNDNEERKLVWEASKQIGQVVEKLLLQRVKLCNKIASELGFKNSYSMEMTLQEIDEEELFQLFDELEAKTREPFLAIKEQLDLQLVHRFGLHSKDELRPWHYADPFFQDAPQITSLDMDLYFKDQNLEELTVKSFDRIGLDIRPVLKQGDYYEREGKDQHAFCMMIGHHPDQVKVLCNCRNTADWMGTMLHEFGHAIYYQFLNPKQNFFLRDVAHTCTTEAMAMLFGRQVNRAVWLNEVLGLSDEVVKEVAQDAEKEMSWQMLLVTRWILVMVHFERALYANPERDLNTLWWDLVEKFQGLKRPEGRNLPDWATKIHFAIAPVYYHNYLLGEMSASQIECFIENRLGDQPLIRQPHAGQWLKEQLFWKGAERPWNETLKMLTGEKLNPKYFLDQFVNQKCNVAT